MFHEGKHPLYDIIARIVDLQKASQLKGQFSLDTMKYTDATVQIGNLIPRAGSVLQTFQLGDVMQRDFNIFFSARNGMFEELLRLRKIDGHWRRALRVRRNEKTVFEKIDKEFPRNNKGEVE